MWSAKRSCAGFMSTSVSTTVNTLPVIAHFDFRWGASGASSPLSAASTASFRTIEDHGPFKTCCSLNHLRPRGIDAGKNPSYRPAI
jgi:hypothetical protein